MNQCDSLNKQGWKDYIILGTIGSGLLVLLVKLFLIIGTVAPPPYFNFVIPVLFAIGYIMAFQEDYLEYREGLGDLPMKGRVLSALTMFIIGFSALDWAFQEPGSWSVWTKASLIFMGVLAGIRGFEKSIVLIQEKNNKEDE